MDSLLTLPATTESEVRILQVTDTHLFAGKHESLLGVNTWASYDAVLDAIIAQQRDYDLIVATGDLSQDHSVEAYQHFVEGISRLPKPCVWLPGIMIFNLRWSIRWQRPALTHTSMCC